MRKLYWILIFAAVPAILLIGYMFASGWYATNTCAPNPSLEKIEMGQVLFDGANPKNFQINVKYLQGNSPGQDIIFQAAIFKNSTEDIVATDYLYERMKPGTEMTLNFSTDIYLPSGEYIITLVTERGGSFVNPSFTKP
jgi:hypothetical protein